MAQVMVDLHKASQLSIKLYGKNRRLRKEIKHLRMRAQRVKILEDDDHILEIDINQQEWLELEAEKTLSPPPQKPSQKIRVRFAKKTEVRELPTRLMWCENCRESGLLQTV